MATYNPYWSRELYFSEGNFSKATWHHCCGPILSACMSTTTAAFQRHSILNDYGRHSWNTHSPQNMAFRFRCSIIIELQDCSVWKRPLRFSSPIVKPALPSSPLNNVPEFHFWISVKQFQGWWLRHFPRQLLSVLDKPFGDEFLSYYPV